jgi:hypothetical protein
VPIGNGFANTTIENPGVVVDGGQWPVDNEQWTMDNGQWTMKCRNPFTETPSPQSFAHKNLYINLTMVNAKARL